jgi:cell division septation protein DedD
MPDLNLQDEEGSLDNLDSTGGEELTVPAEEEEAPKKKSGALTAVIVIFLILIIGGGGVFLLNRLGVIKLWGKKAAPEVTQMQEPTPVEQQAVGATDTAQVSMVVTPPLAETKKPAQPAKQMPVSAAAPKLGDMMGEYTVQVSAWRDKETADEMVRRLVDAGYPAFVEERGYKDGTWYTVRVGKYATRKDAQLAVANFAEEIRSNHWIDRVHMK